MTEIYHCPPRCSSVCPSNLMFLSSLILITFNNLPPTISLRASSRCRVVRNHIFLNPLLQVRMCQHKPLYRIWKEERALFCGGHCGGASGDWFPWSQMHSPLGASQQLGFPGRRVHCRRVKSYPSTSPGSAERLSSQSIWRHIWHVSTFLFDKSKHSSCRAAYRVSGIAVDPSLALSPLQNCSPQDALVHRSQHHTCLSHLLSPEHKHAPAVVPGGRGKKP